VAPVHLVFVGLDLSLSVYCCVPINRYTADILDETRNVLLEAGMSNVMPKPEPMHDFVVELRTMLRREARKRSQS
jgi:DNA-binding response OmpR family regulator